MKLPLRCLQPRFAYQRHLYDLCEHHVAKQREEKEWPIKRWQLGEAQCGGQGRIRQPHADGHDDSCRNRERPTGPALNERDLLGADYVYDPLFVRRREAREHIRALRGLCQLVIGHRFDFGP